MAHARHILVTTSELGCDAPDDECSLLPDVFPEELCAVCRVRWYAERAMEAADEVAR